MRQLYGVTFVGRDEVSYAYRYEVQAKSPSGGWVTSISCDDTAGAVNHARWLRNGGAEVRVVDNLKGGQVSAPYLTEPANLLVSVERVRLAQFITLSAEDQQRVLREEGADPTTPGPLLHAYRKVLEII